MFTGIVEEIGKIVSIKKNRESMELMIRARKVLENTEIGDSIAVNGVCLTVNEIINGCFRADVMHETINSSCFYEFKVNSIVNLERALCIGDRMGGHIVSGHIDGTGIISSIKKDDNAYWYKIEPEESILDFIVNKGSICIDGVSLTVADVGEDYFSVSIIPHTWRNTILSDKKEGSRVNLENDQIGKYIYKFVRKMDKRKSNEKDINLEFLVRNGF